MGLSDQLRLACRAIEASPLAAAIRESAWLFPTIETLHVLALVLVVGTIAIVDLRLLGVYQRAIPVTRLTEETLPVTWTSFTVAAATGTLMFISQAERFFDNTPFRVKLGLLALAGLNMALFHLIPWRNVARWDRAAPPLAARAAGAASLSLWIAVVVFGRWIGFT